MSTSKEQIVWTVSQDGGKSVSGGYAGKDAKRKAESESGGKSRRMTASDFRAAYPNPQIQIITLG